MFAKVVITRTLAITNTELQHSSSSAVSAILAVSPQALPQGSGHGGVLVPHSLVRGHVSEAQTAWINMLNSTTSG